MARERRDIPLAGLSLDATLDAPERRCDHPGCGCAGDFRAPRSRAALDEFYWFCLEHVRAYNSAWDYFAGMSQHEIEDFQRSAATWHRPTWRLAAGPAGEPRMHDPMSFFARDPAEGAAQRERDAAANPWAPRDAEHRQSLAVLGLDGHVTLNEIKMRYKQLVKRFHPDANPGDHGAEERFKKISAAYRYLLSCGYT